jgi:antitoxin (DNA-binding transcriptional repressor) of toxin-antitoxin stability system
MKVKIGELKTHLSRYLSELRKGGEAIEVCVREEPVAYLTAISADGPKASFDVESAELNKRLKENGLIWDGHFRGKACSFKPKPTLAGDKTRNISTIEAIRAERDW